VWGWAWGWACDVLAGTVLTSAMGVLLSIFERVFGI